MAIGLREDYKLDVLIKYLYFCRHNEYQKEKHIKYTWNIALFAINISASEQWNVGGGSKRNAFIQANNALFGINPNIHGFKVLYYRVGKLRR